MYEVENVMKVVKVVCMCVCVGGVGEGRGGGGYCRDCFRAFGSFLAYDTGEDHSLEASQSTLQETCPTRF